MAFRVEIAPRAFADLDAIAEYIEEHGDFESARRWFNGIFVAMRALGEMPRRHRVANEPGGLAADLRILLYGGRNRRYKIYYSIDQESGTVRVFHVRHWARRDPGTDEIEGMMDEFGDQEEG